MWDDWSPSHKKPQSSSRTTRVNSFLTLLHNRVDEAGAVRSTYSGNVVPARTRDQGAIQPESKPVPTRRGAFVEGAGELLRHIRADNRHRRLVHRRPTCEDVAGQVGRRVLRSLDDVEHGAMRQGVHVGRSQTSRMTGVLHTLLIDDGPNPGKHRAGGASSADDADREGAGVTVRVDDGNASVRIGRERDVRLLTSGARQTALVRRLGEELAHAAAAAIVKAMPR